MHEMKTYSIKLHIITPVIINTGEDYEPFSLYPIRTSKENRGQILNIESLADFLRRNKYEELIRIACRGLINPEANEELLKAQRIIEEAYQTAKEENKLNMLIKRTCILSPEARNALLKNPCKSVARHIVNPYNERPYIPGSSLKGAIRTAVLEDVRKNKNIDYSHDRNRSVEAQILYGYNERINPEKDPFKYLKISDFEFENSRTLSTIGMVNAGGKIPVFTAMTDSWVNSKTDVIARGTISIVQRADTPKWLNIKSLLVSVHDFYADMLNNKCSKAGRVPKAMDPVIGKLNSAESSDYYFMRLGHYIGLENITMNVPNPKRYLENDKGTGHYITIEGDYLAGFCQLELEEN